MSKLHKKSKSDSLYRLMERPELGQVDVENALRIARPTLGEESGVALFRIVRLLALEDSFGRGASAMAYYAGKKLGASLGLGSVDDFVELCTALKVGIIEIPFASDERIHVDVRECVTCSGLRPVGRPLCHLEGGLIAGVVESLFGRRARAVEVTCIGGLGDGACGFDIEFIRPKS